MAQSRTLFIGMDVHNDAIAVAYGAQDHGAEVPSLGAMGTRLGDIDQLVRQMPAKATHLICVYAAGPCSSWLSRYLRKKGYDCWGVAPGEWPPWTWRHRNAVILHCACHITPRLEERTGMTTAQGGYTPVHRGVKPVLGHTHAPVVVTMAWAVRCLLVAQRVTSAALART
jgi:hypothetical protein